MKTSGRNNTIGHLLLLLAGIAGILAAQVTQARDTDIYAANVMNNAYILLDDSGSMAYGVYEDNIDYGAMYTYYLNLGSVCDPNFGISTPFVPYKRDTIYLLQGSSIGVSIFNAAGKSHTFTGDTGSNGSWSGAVDTHTTINASGQLVWDGDTSGGATAASQRLTTDANGYVRLDGVLLPGDQKVLLTNPVNAGTDIGFKGLMQAPGNYFSGWTTVTTTTKSVATSGTTASLCFLVKGNWANLQNVFNLRYGTSTTCTGSYTWQNEPYIGTTLWNTPPSFTAIAYPSAGNTTNYSNSRDPAAWSISQPAAASGSIQVQFSFFDVNSSGHPSDYVKVCNGSGNNCTTYNNANMSAGQWSASILGSSVQIFFHSNSDNSVGKGFTISTYRYTTNNTGNYMIQTRMQVAQAALNTVVSNDYNKLYWGFATFSSNTDGASFGAYVNNTTPATLLSLQTAINNAVADGGTPLGGALQDMFQTGYYAQQTNIKNQGCNKNFVLVLTDGFPSVDTNWTKINHQSGTSHGHPVYTADIDFLITNDGDGWISDPSQPPTDPNYYDSVANYLYTHSFYDKTAIAAADQPNSSKNIRTYQMAFGVVHPLLQDAAIDGGGADQYFSVFNTAQVVQAIEQSVGSMINAVSYTAPVASVDATNKIQNGDDLYFGLFLPEGTGSWNGNLKKFKLGNASLGQDPMMIYDGAGNKAINTNGNFLSTVTDIWTGKTGPFGVTDNGAGQLLLDRVKNDVASVTTNSNPALYWSRNIRVLGKLADGTDDPPNPASPKIPPLFKQTVTPAALGLTTTDTATRNKIINYVYGYTYNADANGYPVADPATGSPVRTWVIGSIIHSKPVVIDYYNTTDLTTVIKRYVVVGANDGMLHVFEDTPVGPYNTAIVGNPTIGINSGKEIAAFIPGDLLPNLQKVAANGGLVDMVDGTVTLYRRAKEPKYLIFGERRGGDQITAGHSGAYWCLDISNTDPSQWTVKWKYTNPIIAQSWSDVQVASVPYRVDNDGTHYFQDVAIFTGGYDPLEDNYPELFTDTVYKTGNPYNTTPIAMLTMTSGHYPLPDTTVWNPTTQDTVDVTGHNNTYYDPYNPIVDQYGQGIFVVDIDDPTITFSLGAKQILPFQVTYNASASLPSTLANTSTGNSQTRNDMKFSFPASPAVVVGAYNYTYRDSSGKVQAGINTNTLISIYAIDIYANLFRVNYSFLESINQNAKPTNPLAWTWTVTNSDWSTTKIFSANPGSSNSIDNLTRGTAVAADQGRKAFYPPAVSWGGTGSYFDKGNYSFPSTTFSGTSKIATLLFGTGDREHPSYTMIANRMYSVYDDSTVTATYTDSNGNVTTPVVSTVGYNGKDGYTENDLLNVTCGIDGPYTDPNIVDHTVSRAKLVTFLTDDATYAPVATLPQSLALENGAHENDAKGWYIVLMNQGGCQTTSGQMNNISNDLNSTDNHTGEAVDSQPILYAGNAYFTTYQPTSGNSCNPTGNGYAYSVDYTTGSAVFNLNTLNGSTIEITDRYMKYTDIYGIPSGFSIFTSGGQAGAMAMMGSQLIGPKGPGAFQIPSPGLGLELYYWREGNSQSK